MEGRTHHTCQVQSPGSEPVSAACFRNPTADESGDLVVVGAHYDAVTVTPGADDNASGVAELLELAYGFGRIPPPCPVELAAYTLEETGMQGSAEHASFWTEGFPAAMVTDTANP